MNIRLETKNDYSKVEELTREAFWNLYRPGCDEHYLCHILREHTDFIRELDYVVELNGNIVASIMYSDSVLIGEDNEIIKAVSFGPLCVHPEYQRKGIGGKLLKYLISHANTSEILVGTWEAATWAIRFYEEHRFKLVSTEEKDSLLRKYWDIPERQIETSVVLKLKTF